MIGIMVSVGAIGRLARLSPNPRAPRTRVSSSKAYLAGKLQWHFTCGFDLRHDCNL